jgi:hypothetical protein
MRANVASGTVLRDALGSGLEVTVGSNGEVVVGSMPPQSALILVP